MMTAEEFLTQRLVKEASFHQIEMMRDLAAASYLSGGMEKNAVAITGTLGTLLGLGSGGMYLANQINNFRNSRKLLDAQINALAKQTDAVSKIPGMNPWVVGGAAALGTSIPMVAGKIYDAVQDKKKAKEQKRLNQSFNSGPRYR